MVILNGGVSKMKLENVGLFALIFLFGQLMWMCFLNGIYAVWHPTTGMTITIEYSQVILESILYFLPGSIILSIVWFKFREKPLRSD